MADVAEVKEFVQRALAQYFEPQVFDKGLAFAFEGSALFVMTFVDRDVTVLIDVTYPVLSRVEATPELFEHVSLHNDGYRFGHLYCISEGDTVSVVFAHRFVGDPLDESELIAVLNAFIETAVELGPALQPQFGGVIGDET
jgi:hypothetical protein